jgi:hypothetical protein
MGRKAAVISIDLNASTAKMILEMEKGKAALHGFGSSGASAMAPTSVALRELEGNFANNTRGAARFLATTLGLGPALQAAFPLFGAIAFAGMIGSIATKTYEFFKSVQEAPAKINAAFGEMTGSIRVANTELDLNNARLENQIAKLQGQPENKLKVALLEAQLAAEKLWESLEKDINHVNELLTKVDVGTMRKLLGEAGSGDIKDYFNQVGNRMDLSTGADQRTAILKEAQAKVSQWIADAQAAARPTVIHGFTPGGGFMGGDTTVPGKDETARLAILAKLQQILEGLLHQIQSSEHGSTLPGQVRNAEEAHKNAELMAQREKELADARSGVGAGGNAVVAAEHELIKVRADGLAQIKQDETEHRSAALRTIDEQILAQKELNAYQKVGYEATKQADEEARKAEEEQQQRNALEKFVEEESAKRMKDLTLPSHQTIKEWEEDMEAQRQIRAIQIGTDREGAIRQASRAGQISQIQSGGDPIQAINQAYQTRINLAQELKNIEMASAADEANAAKKRVDEAKAEADYQKEAMNARLEKEMAILKLQQQQVEQVKNAISGPLSSGLAKLATGQKADFGKAFQSSGEGLIKDSIDKLTKMGLGKLGAVFGIGGKRGDSPAMPLYVSPVGGGLALPGGGRTGVPNGLSTGGLFGDGAQGGGIFSWLSKAAFGGFMAGGGDVDPGQAYVVGEHEPEIFSPGTRGTITPMSKMGGATFHIDARGADLGAANRISRAIEASHASAVGNAVRANAEHAHRTPQRSNG